MSRIALFFLATMSLLQASSTNYRIYIGTYTNDGNSRGIYSTLLDRNTGAISMPQLAVETPNPSFLSLNPNGKILYASSEMPGTAGKPVGAASAFTLENDEGRLTFLNQELVGEPGAPCFVMTDPSGRTLLATQYGAGYVAILPISSDGSLRARSSHYFHTGTTGPSKPRQDKPHAHSFTVSPDGHYAIACDLGLDRLLVYRLDTERATMEPEDKASVATPPGVGPRHAKFTRDSRFLYVLGELSGTVEVYSYGASDATLSHLQTISTLPDGFKGENSSAEIRISTNGRFVYASNRGPDLLTVFARDAKSGRLSLVQTITSGGKHPRNFALSPDGRWLVCANRDSDNLAVFRVDTENGRLTPGAITEGAPKAVCVLFAP